MNIIEVMQLEPGTEVKSTAGKFAIEYDSVSKNKYLINASTNNKMPISTFLIDLNFELCKEDEKVDFMEAIKAYMKGKEVYCKFANNVNVYTYESVVDGRKYAKDCFYCSVKDTQGHGISIGEIFEGQWYIKNN